MNIQKQNKGLSFFFFKLPPFACKKKDQIDRQQGIMFVIYFPFLLSHHSTGRDHRRGSPLKRRRRDQSAGIITLDIIITHTLVNVCVSACTWAYVFVQINFNSGTAPSIYMDNDVRVSRSLFNVCSVITLLQPC